MHSRPFSSRSTSFYTGAHICVAQRSPTCSQLSGDTSFDIMRVEHPDTHLPNDELDSKVRRFDDYPFPESCWMTAPDLPTLSSELHILDTFLESGNEDCLDPVRSPGMCNKVTGRPSPPKSTGSSHAAAVNLLSTDVRWSFSYNAESATLTTEVLFFDWGIHEAEIGLKRFGLTPYTTHASQRFQTATTDAEAEYKLLASYASSLEDVDVLSAWRSIQKYAKVPFLKSHGMQSCVQEHMRAVSDQVLHTLACGQPDKDGSFMSLTDTQYRSFDLLRCEVPTDLMDGIQRRLDGKDLTPVSLAPEPDCMRSRSAPGKSTRL